jgi:MFS family permease
MLGDAMLPVALTVGVLAAGHGTSGVGYALGSWMAALAVCMLFGGVLADRFTPRRMMIISDVVRFVVQAGMAVVFLAGVPSLWLIVLLQVLSGMATAMFQPGVASMVPKVADDVQKANGVLRVAESLAFVFGPALAGLLVSMGGPETVFAIYSLTYAISALCLLSLRLAPSVTSAEDSTFLRNLLDGWQAFRSRNWLWSVIAVYVIYGCFVAGASLPVGASLVVADHGANALGIGMGAFGLGGVLGGAVAMRYKPSRPLAVGSVGWLLFTLSPLAPALAPPVPLLAVGWGLAGAGLAFWSVIWATTIQTHIPGELLNRVYAYDVTGSLLSLALGRTVAGPMAAVVGERELMYISTGLGLICCALLLAVPSIRQLRRVN